MASNRFQKLMQSDPEAAQRVTAFLMATQHAAMQTMGLQQLLLDEAGMIQVPPAPPAAPGVPQAGPPVAGAPVVTPDIAQPNAGPIVPAAATPPVPTQ